MNQKRSLIEVDSDYLEFDVPTEHQSKRQKLLEHDAKEATIKKIEAIVGREFARDLSAKEAEIHQIDERINEARRLLDRLRACIVAQQYSKVIPYGSITSNSSYESQPSSIHPVVKKFLGKMPKSSRHLSRTLTSATSTEVKAQSFAADCDSDRHLDKRNTRGAQIDDKRSETTEPCRGDRFRIIKKVIVGNVSKYLASDKKEDNDKSTHKWMVYVRTPKGEPPIEEFVEKVTFFLHDSYWPNDVVEITQPPFHLTRRGWGEFPIRAQLHCRGEGKRSFNVSHQLKLDRTYTGLQTIGAETVLEIKLDKEVDRSTMGRFIDDVLCTAGSSQVPEEIHIKQEKVDDNDEDDDGSTPKSSSQGNSDMRSNGFARQITDHHRPKAGSTASRDGEMVLPCVFQKFGTSPEKQTIASSKIVGLANSPSIRPCSSGLTPPTAKESHSKGSVQQAETNGEETTDLVEGSNSVSVREDVEIFSSKGENRKLSSALAFHKVHDNSSIVCEKTQVFGGGQEECDEGDIPIKIEPTENDGTCGDVQSSRCETGSALGLEQVSCADIEEEVVHGDTICVEPASYVCEGSRESVKDGTTDNAKTSYLNCSRDPGKVRRGIGGIPAAGSLITSSSIVCPSKNRAFSNADGQDFLRCVDSVGRIFKIPRHLMRTSLTTEPNISSVVVKTTSAESAVATAIAGSASATAASSRAVTKATGCHVVSPKHLSLVDGRTSNGPSQEQRLCVNRTSDAGSELSMLKNAKPGSILNTSAFIVSGNRPEITGRLPGNAAVVLPQRCSSSLFSRAMVFSTRPGNELKAVTFVTPGGAAKESPSSAVQVFLPKGNKGPDSNSQIVPLKNGAVFSSGPRSARDAPNDPILKTVTLQHATGLGISRQSVVLNKGKPAETLVKASCPSASCLPLKQVVVGSPVSSAPSFRALSHRTALALPSSTPTVKSSSPSDPVARPVVTQCGSTVKSRMNYCDGAGPCGSKPDQPVFLVLPSSRSKGHAPVSSVQSSIRPLVFLSKGGVKELSGVSPNVHPTRVLAQQSSICGTNQSAEGTVATKRTSVLRPSAGSSMTSLLKKPATSTLNSSSSASGGAAKSSSSSDSGAFHSLRKCDETVIKTQIGNQTVVIKLDPVEEAKRRQLDANSKAPSSQTPSFSSQPKFTVVSSLSTSEKHLMFKSMREAQKQQATEDDNSLKNIELNDLARMEDLVRAVVRCHPIYGENVDRSVHPYCAPSWNAYLQWNVGKRRAAELCRAVAVLRKISMLLNGETAFNGEAMWTKRQLILWCRHHLYTPFEKEMFVNSREEVKRNPVEIHLSLTDHRELVQKLDTFLQMEDNGADVDKNEDCDDTVLDVLSVDNSSDKQEETQQRSCANILAGVTGEETIPSSVEAQFVQETARKIGISFSPAPVLPLECPDVTSSTSEEMIAAATRAFANELVRTACADQYENERNPLELDVPAICRSILKLNRCDFLTNRLLGVSVDDPS